MPGMTFDHARLCRERPPLRFERMPFIPRLESLGFSGMAYKKMMAMGKGIFEVLVDTETSKENVSRLAQQLGWRIEVRRVVDDYSLILKKE